MYVCTQLLYISLYSTTASISSLDTLASFETIVACLLLYVTGFGKTDHIVTINISRNTDLKYLSRHGSLMLDCSHARLAV